MSDVKIELDEKTERSVAPLTGGKNSPEETPRQIKVHGGRWVPQLDAKGVEETHISNIIRTSKYTALTFPFVNLYEQIKRPANFYFVIIAVLQVIKEVSISQGEPTILLPLSFVMVVSAIKDAIEDHKRHIADRRENEREYSLMREQAFTRITAAELCVGDIVQIKDEEVFPADLLLVHTGSEDAVYCYVETSNLDGETNLKIKSVPEPTKFIRGPEDTVELNISIQCDAPSGKLETFGGLLKSEQGKEALLGIDNLLLRGSKLKNTGYVYGLVIYTGEQTKIRMNSLEKNKVRVKRSKVERYTNKQMIGTVIMQTVVCLLAGIGAGTWQANHEDHGWYLDLSGSSAVAGIERFFTWFIIFAYLVPISLLVSMEMVKFWQGLFIGWDIQMSYLIANERQFARAQTSGLNEELGYVQYILSDKTGTLTCNRMDFRKCVIGGINYGTGETDISRAAKQRKSVLALGKGVVEKEEDPAEIAPHVHFNHRRKMVRAIRKNTPQSKMIDEYLTCLSLSNTVFPSAGSDGHAILKASSPDEQALVEYARFMGYELYERNPPQVQVRILLPDDDKGPYKYLNYEQLACLDFTSKRKRMSVVVRTPEGQIKVLTKGADSLIAPLLRGYNDDDPEGSLSKAQPHWQKTMAHLARFGDQGLRTLLVASSTRDAVWWDDPHHGWGRRYSEGMKECAVEGPSEEGHFKGSCRDDCRRCSLENALELDSQLELVGATAIEDKLQDHVPSTIKALLDGGMNVWVLTGDKLETAINIGMACNLLESSMERKGNLLRIEAEDKDTVGKEIDSHVGHIRWLREEKKSSEPCGLVITSGAFAAIMHADRDILNKFLWVATRCKSVVGCRMQPNQKAKIVNLVKTTQQVTTLAIGDGANDEQMIREADVGVGIRGVEGTTAVRASDYAISQFHFLRRLLFVHGRLNYRRIATLISYIFYKNTLICFTTLWFGFVCGFSGQPLFLTWAYQGYNIVYTAIPILAFATFDRDIPQRKLQREPKIYTLSQHGELFNVVIFWKWIILGLLHSLVIFYIPYICYNDVAMDNTGQSYGLWEVGVVMYTSIVIVVNLKIALLSCSWTIIHHITIWGSILAYFITMFIFGASSVFSNAGADYAGMIVRLFGTPRFWFTCTVTVIIALYIDYLIFALHELDVAKKLMPAQFERWLLETFPTSNPPDPAYIPDPSTLPKPKQGVIKTARVHASSTEGGGEQEKKNGPGGSGGGSSPQLQSKSRGHTGYDFDYTPREASRLERRSSRSKSRASEGGTPRGSAPGSPSKVLPMGMTDEA